MTETDKPQRKVIAAISPAEDKEEGKAANTLLKANKGKFDPKTEQLREDYLGPEGDIYVVRFEKREEKPVTPPRSQEERPKAPVIDITTRRERQ
ncbi:MAG TPA: hypothetical protein VF189_02070 [Patescibacteria group bacterium]